MDNGNLSSSVFYQNPFDGESFEGQDAQLCSEEVFDMSGTRLQQELDEENKLVVQEDSANGTDFSSPSLGPSLSSISGGSDTMLMNKLGITQYLTYKSEPLGTLGSPLTPTKRPWFGNTILSPRRDIHVDACHKEEPAEAISINDLNLEPSWLKNQSLSLLSESEQFEIPGGSKENSQDWLTGLPACSNIPGTTSFIVKPKTSNLTYNKDLSFLVNLETSAALHALYLSNGDDVCKRSSSDISRGNHSVTSSNHLSIEPCSERSSTAKDHSTSRYVENVPEGYSATEVSAVEAQSSGGCNSASDEMKSVESLISHLTTEESLAEIKESLQEESQSYAEVDVTQSPNADEMPQIVNYNSKLVAEIPPQDSISLHEEPQKASTDPEIKKDISIAQNLVCAVEQPGTATTTYGNEYVDLEKKKEDSFKIPALLQNPAEEEGELPSLYWRSAFPADCSSRAVEVHSLADPEPVATNSCSYVVGTVEPAHSCSPNLCRSASPSSQSDASTVRANPSQFCVNSVLTDEPQLSSTREISDDDDSTPRLKESSPREIIKLTNNTKDTGAADGIGVESILKLFANTTSLPTPCLMDRVRIYMSERHKGRIDQGEVSSGLGESHFGGESSSCSSEASDGDTPVNPGPKKPVTFKNTPFPRHLSLPVHSTPLAPALRLRPPARPAVITEKEEFAHVTATVMKKKKVPAALVPEGRLKNAPAVKCNKSHMYFGSVSLRDKFDRLETLTLRNSSFGEPLDLELRIEETSPFKIVTNSVEKDVPVSKRLEKFGPREEKTITVSFQPSFAGIFEAKLNLYPRGDQFRRIKYSVDLFGYAGESLVCPQDQADVIYPQLNGSSLKYSLTLANNGTICGFALISVQNDDGAALKCSRLLVVPECFTLNPKETRDVQLLIEFPSAADARPFNLIVTYGDDILRQRWTRAMMDGAEWKNPSGLELTKLIQLGSTSCGPTVLSQDIDLFNRNLKKQKIRFSPEVSADDSEFMTLKAESTTASLLQSQLADKTNTALDTLLSQRRLTSTVSTKKIPTEKDGQVCLGTSEIAFPATRVGAVSTQKIPLQNWSQITQEIRIVKITGPFSVRHLRSAIPAGFYSKLPILFHPVKPGAHAGTVLLEVGTNNYPLTVKVRGEAV